MALHFMSDKELSRVEILRDLARGRLTVSAAAELMGLERRQVQRLTKAYQDEGVTALVRQMPESLKTQALELTKARYADFRPTWLLRRHVNVTICQSVSRRYGNGCSRWTVSQASGSAEGSPPAQPARLSWRTKPS